MADPGGAVRGEGERVPNLHVASPPPPSPRELLTETSGGGGGGSVGGATARGKLVFHRAAEQQHGHVRVGDGQAVCDVVGGKIVTHGAAWRDAGAGAASGGHPPAEGGGGRRHASHHVVHHRELLVDGTHYATGASRKPPHAEGQEGRSSLAYRIKEALPGTKEHAAKKEAEGDLAVYM